MARIRGRSVGSLASGGAFVEARLAVRRHGAVSWRIGWLIGVMEQIGGGSVGWLAPWSGLLAVWHSWFGVVKQLVGGMWRLVWTIL
uniref:Uncharacterized protein n=1 Tax=Caenorhabditis japonica TaxID=281687 RepID=A0A8R1EC07_CAEJA